MEYKSGDKWERKNMDKTFMNCSKNLIDICQKTKTTQKWLLNKEYLMDDRCEGTNMAWK